MTYFVIPSVAEESPYRLGGFLDKLEMTTTFNLLIGISVFYSVIKGG